MYWHLTYEGNQTSSPIILFTGRGQGWTLNKTNSQYGTHTRLYRLLAVGVTVGMAKHAADILHGVQSCMGVLYGPNVQRACL